MLQMPTPLMRTVLASVSSLFLAFALPGFAQSQIPYCHYQSKSLEPGSTFCGIEFRRNGSVRVDGSSAFSVAHSGENLRPIEVFPGSPDGKMRFMVAGSEREKWFVVNQSTHEVTKVRSGKPYGPASGWISWSPSGTFAAVEYADEGYNWIVAFSTQAGAATDIFNENDYLGFVDENNFMWLDDAVAEYPAFNCADYFRNGTGNGSGLDKCWKDHEDKARIHRLYTTRVDGSRPETWVSQVTTEKFPLLSQLSADSYRADSPLLAAEETIGADPDPNATKPVTSLACAATVYLIPLEAQP